MRMQSGVFAGFGTGVAVREFVAEPIALDEVENIQMLGGSIEKVEFEIKKAPSFTT